MTLIEMRSAVEYTQAEVAAHVGGVTQGAVSQWEKGLVAPRFDKLLALAKLYGVSADEIIQAIQEAKTT